MLELIEIRVNGQNRQKFSRTSFLPDRGDNRRLPPTAKCPALTSKRTKRLMQNTQTFRRTRQESAAWPRRENDRSKRSVHLHGALEEQLGLELASTKGPAEVLVIDHVGQPTPD
jgi:hypothetical protein